ncbi:hypothetical protein [Nocardioides coralli]|nr:hypothetical protein [Nocardioides coralli]
MHQNTNPYLDYELAYRRERMLEAGTGRRSGTRRTRWARPGRRTR